MQHALYGMPQRSSSLFTVAAVDVPIKSKKHRSCLSEVSKVGEETKNAAPPGSLSACRLTPKTQMSSKVDNARDRRELCNTTFHVLHTSIHPYLTASAAPAEETFTNPSSNTLQQIVFQEGHLPRERAYFHARLRSLHSWPQASLLRRFGWVV